MTQDPGKIGPLIKAVRKVTSAPTHFLGSWCTLVRSEVLRAGGAGDELQHFFEGDSLALCNKAGFDAVPRESLTVEGGSRLHELEGRTEVTLSMTARGCQGLKVIEECHGMS